MGWSEGIAIALFALNMLLGYIGWMNNRNAVRIDRDRADLIKKVEKQDDKIDVISSDTDRNTLTVKTLGEAHSKLHGRVDEINSKSDTHFSMTRDSLHEVRTLIGTKYLTREEFQVFVNGISDKIDRIPEIIKRDTRQMLADMRLIGRRDED